MEAQKQKRKDSNNSNDDIWIKCESKVHPGKYNLFNKATGEIKWCKSSDSIPNVQLDTPGTSYSTHSKDRERQTLPKYTKSKLKTPAQDRLKRLQHKFGLKNKSKSPAKEKNNNERNEEPKNVQHPRPSEDFLEPKPSITQKQNEKSPSKASCSRSSRSTKSDSTRKVESRLSSAPCKKSLKSPSSKSAKAAKRQHNCSSTDPVKSSSTNLAEAEAKSEDNLQSAKRKRSSSKSNLQCSLSTNAEAPQNVENDPTMDMQMQPTTSIGLVDRIKKIYHTTIESYNNAKKKLGQRNQEMSIEKPQFKIPKTSEAIINKPMVVKQTLKAMQNDYLEDKQTTLLYSPVTLTSTPATSAILLTENKNEGTTPQTSKTLIVPSYERGSVNNRLEQLRVSLMQQAANGKMTSVSKSCPSILTTPTAPSNHQTASQMAADIEEPMDWTPIEEPTISGKYSTSDTNVRNSSEPSRCDLTVCEYYKAVNDNLMRLAAEQKTSVHFESNNWLKGHYYFVIDTNVMLRNLTFVEDLSQMQLCDTNGSVLFIPYSVLQELDKLKQFAPKESVKLLAARAIKFLNAKFEAKSKHVIAQSATSELDHLIEVNSPDDRILNCCLQVKQQIEHVLLLTEDTNLRNKAICNNILVSTKSDLLSLHPTK